MPYSNTPVAVEQPQKPPFVNCHTHVFTGDHVPPYLGKKLLPFGLGYVFTIQLIVHFFRWWYQGPYKWQFGKRWKSLQKKFYHYRIAAKRNALIGFINTFVSTLLTVDALLILYDWVKHSTGLAAKQWTGFIDSIQNFLINLYLLPATSQLFLRILLVLVVLLLIPTGRNLILFTSRMFFRFLRFLPGPRTTEFFIRYLSIGRFAFHKKQHTIFYSLSRQYPRNTRFVVLPMDMDYMEAGAPAIPYLEQLKELKNLRQKNETTLLPFVFADPRRLAAQPHYYQTIVDCIEKEGFKGIKTYPALGYYPFDPHLLPLMLYACENGIPVLNHCIRGVIYYRGAKKKEWDQHPLFIQSTGEKNMFEPLQLLQVRNSSFTTNFTHPLNYLCLLDEKRLRRLLQRYNNHNLFDLFGYTNEHTPLQKDLRRLKICFGHFGGEDEWNRYLESDRYNTDNALLFHAGRGIDFSLDTALEGIWHHTSWYSIICSLMLQYPHVYADISYTLHNPEILPLLKATLQPEIGVADRVLFGSDFYVVRSEMSDKQMMTHLAGALPENMLHQIAVDNPHRFLYNKIHGPIK